MAEYIEREKAIDAIMKAVDAGFSVTAEDLEATLENLPAADVAPVVHGKPVYKLRHGGGIHKKTGWDSIGNEQTIMCDERYEYKATYCPICGKCMEGLFLHYCDNCGTKMDVEVE